MHYSRPPLLTVMQEILGWTLDRTADMPKSQRFTFGQRLDGLTLDALLRVQRAAVTGDRAAKVGHLNELSIGLEELNLLWELVHDRRWISQQQLVFIAGRLGSAHRNNNTPDNRNDNIGFRCVLVVGSSPKAEPFCAMSGGSSLPGRCQESSLTAAPAPVGVTGKDAVVAVPGKPGLKGTAALLAQPLTASAPASLAPLPLDQRPHSRVVGGSADILVGLFGWPPMGYPGSRRQECRRSAGSPTTPGCAPAQPISLLPSPANVRPNPL